MEKDSIASFCFEKVGRASSPSSVRAPQRKARTKAATAEPCQREGHNKQALSGIQTAHLQLGAVPTGLGTPITFISSHMHK